MGTLFDVTTEDHPPVKNILNPIIRGVYWSICDPDPIRLQGDRFTSRQVKAPQAVLHMTDKRQPGRTAFSRYRVVTPSQNPPNHILIYGGPERQIALLGDSRTSPGGLRRFISTT
jgi:hypothetical protein